jgi:UDP-glucose 4-epimerase
MDVAGCLGRPRADLHDPALFQRGGRRYSRPHRPVDQGRDAPIKAASETALGKRSFIEVFGSDYPTPDGTCIRDFIHVGDLVAAHRLALQRMREGGGNLLANCGYSHGYSVLEVLESVKRVNGSGFDVRMTGRRAGSVVANSDRARRELDWKPRHDDLDLIVRTALDWERGLQRKNAALAV